MVPTPPARSLQGGGSSGAGAEEHWGPRPVPLLGKFPPGHPELRCHLVKWAPAPPT